MERNDQFCRCIAFIIPETAVITTNDERYFDQLRNQAE